MKILKVLVGAGLKKFKIVLDFLVFVIHTIHVLGKQTGRSIVKIISCRGWVGVFLFLLFSNGVEVQAFPGESAIRFFNTEGKVGKASYYTYESCKREGTSGVWTASGERFDENAMTCALRSRDWGGRYKVTNLANGRSVVVRHNDFGPNKKLYEQGRVIDLSKGAFEKIADLRKGLITVKVEKL